MNVVDTLFTTERHSGWENEIQYLEFGNFAIPSGGSFVAHAYNISLIALSVGFSMSFSQLNFVSFIIKIILPF